MAFKKKVKHSLNIWLISAFLVLNLHAFSQIQQTNKEVKKPFKDRIFIGGGLGFSVGNYSSLIDVSPLVGYAVTDNFVAGIGLTYKYYRLKDYYQNIDNGDLFDYKTNIYGGSIWARYFLTGIDIPVLENMFLHAEIEPLIFNQDYSYNPAGNFIDPYGNRYALKNQQVTLTSYFLGGGLRQFVGGKSYLYIEVLWNFNEDIYSPYSNPRIMFGFAAGL